METYLTGLHDRFNRGRLSIEALSNVIKKLYQNGKKIGWKKASIESRLQLK